MEQGGDRRGGGGDPRGNGEAVGRLLGPTFRQSPKKPVAAIRQIDPPELS